MILAAGSAAAQSALEGPLASPDAAVGKPKAKPSVHHHKPAKVAHAASPKAPTYSGAEGAPATDRGISNTAAPVDPLSFGMKWNGSNDNARDTRIQNYNGDAQGSGAEVGMKLHF